MLFQGFHPTTTTNTTSSLSATQWTKLLLNFHLILRYLRAACTKDESDKDDEEDKDGDDCHEDPNQRSHLEKKRFVSWCLSERRTIQMTKFVWIPRGLECLFWPRLIRFANLNAANFLQNFAPHSEDGMANSQLSKKQEISENKFQQCFLWLTSSQASKLR